MTHIQFKEMVVHDELGERYVTIAIGLWEDSYNGDALIIRGDGMHICIPTKEALELAEWITQEVNQYKEPIEQKEN